MQLHARVASLCYQQHLQDVLHSTEISDIIYHANEMPLTTHDTDVWYVGTFQNFIALSIYNTVHKKNCHLHLTQSTLDVCMYVCRGIYVRAAAYSLNCHGGAMIYRMLYKTFLSLVERRSESVTSMNHGLSVTVSYI